MKVISTTKSFWIHKILRFILGAIGTSIKCNIKKNVPQLYHLSIYVTSQFGSRNIKETTPHHLPHVLIFVENQYLHILFTWFINSNNHKQFKLLKLVIIADAIFRYELLWINSRFCSALIRVIFLRLQTQSNPIGNLRLLL